MPRLTPLDRALTVKKVYDMHPELKLACDLVVIDWATRVVHLYMDYDLPRMPVIPGYEVRMYPND